MTLLPPTRVRRRVGWVLDLARELAGGSDSHWTRRLSQRMLALLGTVGGASDYVNKRERDRPARSVEEEPAHIAKGVRRGNDQGMASIHECWRRITEHEVAPFRTKSGLPFTYSVVGNNLWITRSGREINRGLSRHNVDRALREMPAARPGELKAVQGSAYVWAILMDDRIRASDW